VLIESKNMKKIKDQDLKKKQFLKRIRNKSIFLNLNFCFSFRFSEKWKIDLKKTLICYLPKHWGAYNIFKIFFLYNSLSGKIQIFLKT
jgi:hypothetical protein